MIPLKDDNPTRTTPYVTVGLIVVNLAMYLFQATLGPTHGVLNLGLIPAEFVSGDDVGPPTWVPIRWTIVTSMFMHGGLFHLAGNMLYLWIFGNNVEDFLGHGSFLLFYLASGFAAAASQVALSLGSVIPMVGASGAVAGVLGAYMVLYPRARVLTLVPIFYFIRLIYLPASLVLGIWFALQLFSGVSALGSQTGGVAWWAHIGGFAAGVGALQLARRVRRRRRGL